MPDKKSGTQSYFFFIALLPQSKNTTGSSFSLVLELLPVDMLRVAALAALYAGYRIWGFGGMILAPLLTGLALQFTAEQSPEV